MPNRLEIGTAMPAELRTVLLGKFGLAESDRYPIDGLLDLTSLRCREAHPRNPPVVW